jgi:hypothetical protein
VLEQAASVVERTLPFHACQRNNEKNKSWSIHATLKKDRVVANRGNGNAASPCTSSHHLRPALRLWIGVWCSSVDLSSTRLNCTMNPKAIEQMGITRNTAECLVCHFGWFCCLGSYCLYCHLQSRKCWTFNCDEELGWVVSFLGHCPCPLHTALLAYMIL